MEITCGKMAANMKATIGSTRNTEKELILILTEVNTKESGKKECSMESAAL